MVHIYTRRKGTHAHKINFEGKKKTFPGHALLAHGSVSTYEKGSKRGWGYTHPELTADLRQGNWDTLSSAGKQKSFLWVPGLRGVGMGVGPYPEHVSSCGRDPNPQATPEPLTVVLESFQFLDKNSPLELNQINNDGFHCCYGLPPRTQKVACIGLSS